MKRRNRKLGPNTSGQLLIVAALAIALLISSTTIYVHDLSRGQRNDDGYLASDLVFALKQSTRSALVSSVVNASSGGTSTVLIDNLADFSQFIVGLHHSGISYLTFSVFNDTEYDSGIKLAWETSDVGVSSGCASFTLRLQGATEDMAMQYAVNVTTSLIVSGSYATLVGGEKLVNVICKAYNEGEPALAKNVTLFYEDNGVWTTVDALSNLSVTDYGNGTYSLSFTVTVSSEALQVSAHMYDLRGICVRANTTCYEA